MFVSFDSNYLKKNCMLVSCAKWCQVTNKDGALFHRK